MYATQKLICKVFGFWLEVRNVSIGVALTKEEIPFFNMSEEYIQLMRNSANHWLMSFSSNDLVHICDNLYINLTPVIKNCLKALCKSRIEKKMEIIN